LDIFRDRFAGKPKRHPEAKPESASLALSQKNKQ
jgi:hypothetical protein